MKIGAYILKKNAKANYKRECYNTRKWPGFEVVLHSLRSSGYEVDYVGEATAHKYDLILMSMTSDCDWWPFIAERTRWAKSKTRVIVGGPGILNVRPFLGIADIFVFGRGESVITKIVNAEEAGERVDDLCVVYSDTFSMLNRYEIRQTEEPYPQEIILANGQKYREQSIGCPAKCLFCAYTWHRKYIGDGGFSAGADSMSKGNKERTIVDLLKIAPEKWNDEGQVRIVGLDGVSERIRKMVNKPISRKMWREFIKKLLLSGKPHQLKVYSIVGYPHETEEDWTEFLEDIRMVDSDLSPGKQWSLLFHFTPFRAMPVTPAAIWPMSYRNYRKAVSRHLKKKSMPGNVFYQGNRFWAVEGMGTESLSTVIESAIVLRGTEEDSERVVALATTSKYWRSNVKTKIATLEKSFDCGRLFGSYTWDNIPTRYLHSYTSDHVIKKLYGQ